MEPAVEDFLPVRTEGLDEDVFDGLVVLVTRVQLAAALRLAQMDTVGGAIAGALAARRLAESFQQNGTQAVALLPVVGELSLQAGQQVGRQRGETDPGQDEIAVVMFGSAFRSLLTTSLMRAPRVRSSQPRCRSRSPSRSGAATKLSTPTGPSRLASRYCSRQPGARPAPSGCPARNRSAHSRSWAGVWARSSHTPPSCRRLPANWTGLAPARPAGGSLARSPGPAAKPAPTASPSAAWPCAPRPRTVSRAGCASRPARTTRGPNRA